MITSDNNRRLQADAEDVAKKLGIELAVLDLCSDFESILDYFCSEYIKGRTPNPCVLCNRYIKFGKLWRFAKDTGADFLATGHYARVLNHASHIGLYESVDPAKDQSYVLSMIDKDVLQYIMLPIGNYSKKQTRLMAAKFGLGTENRKESQEICFVPNDDYTALLEKRHPELVRPGNIIDAAGKSLGCHNGIHRFTIGQRRGLHVAMGKPYYVARIDADSNNIVLAPQEQVMHRRLWAAQVNWLVDKPKSPFQAKVKIRYNDKGSAATIYPDGDSVIVEFDQPKLAITPGQLAVFYVLEQDTYRVFGGGWIDKAAD
jgi:tRNA-specific 2-thiouridylase